MVCMHAVDSMSCGNLPTIQCRSKPGGDVVPPAIVRPVVALPVRALDVHVGEHAGHRVRLGGAHDDLQM